MSEARLWDFPGGIHPPECKALSNRTPIQAAPLPKYLCVPLGQTIGEPAQPCVAVGDRVLKGQKIGQASGTLGVALHAPSSGVVTAIGPQPYPHVSGLPAPAVVIETDGLEHWTDLEPCSDFRREPPDRLLERIREAGISGLGGAGFPTAAKLAAAPRQKVRTLIINGAECEPYITADDLLMREKPVALVQGIDILVHLLDPDEVLIGVEDNKPEAITALEAAIGERPFAVRVIPTRYPSGGEKQLIQILTGLEVPSGGLPMDVGVLCQNVGTCVAIHDAIMLGRPLISRITTLTGEALERPMNVEALIGTPVAELLALAGLRDSRLQRLLMGGPLMGFALPSRDVPLIKTTNCLLAGTAAELPPPAPELPCIRCGDCAQVCPASLLPQQLHFFALGEDHSQLKAHNLFDCIECGACAYVCPSNLPLVQSYRAAKADIREIEQRQHKAEQSRMRFEQRQERLRRADEQKEADRKARAEKRVRTQAVDAETRSVPVQDDPLARVQAQKASTLSDMQKKLKIEASMAQVALKKAQKQLAAHASPELERQVEELRSVAEAAQAALERALTEQPQQEQPAAMDEAALKKLKIEAAMLRAQLRKLEKLGSPGADQERELRQLREALQAAEQKLAEPQPSEKAATPTSGGPLKKAKIDLAMRRAALKKAETAGADESELQPLREQLGVAEQALHAAEEQSQHPAPELIRIDKRPIDEVTRALKTELAYARADLQRLERDDAVAADELEAARIRLTEAERRLSERHTESQP
ncbi:electron transport complex subunit RsxC [Stutzerimonas azotifigens]|uniref:Ion-translocating oxidoreductase complex subunit C n=1 Tax=Stutzerimonas azotifigens TaxID=291995 RepID=A0ABR5YW47_9GAMM|nr:electron transport complex subunit RsxC [Stutzerimonas azotifigens]MBA1272148.1 electron transport complex subunit RsxC [Stutzerimonas azotifigens]